MVYFLLGDVNIQVHDKEKNMDKDVLFTLLGSYNLFPLVKEYTRITMSFKYSLITSSSTVTRNMRLNYLISDHASQRFTCIIQCQNEYTYKRIFNDSNTLLFQERLKPADWAMIYKTNESQ